MKSQAARGRGRTTVEPAEQDNNILQPGFVDEDRVLGRFSDIAMIAADWFWEMDADLHFTFLSGRFEEITGIARASIIGKTREEAFAGYIDDAEKWQKLGAPLHDRDPYSMVWSIRRDDGEIRVLRTRGLPIASKDGAFQGYRGVGSDITDAVIAQQQLNDSENRFRDVINHVTDIVCTADSRFEVRYLNQSIEDILGYSIDETEASQVGQYAVDEDREKITLDTRDAFANPGRVYSGVYRFRHKDGSTRMLETRRQCLVGRDAGHEPQVIIHSRDVTDRHLAEEALRQSEERLRDFAETSADWFWEQDADLRFCYLSGNLPDVDGLRPVDIIGKRREELVPMANLKSEEWKRLLARIDAHEPFYDFEYALPGRDGADYVVRVSGVPKFDASGNFIGYRGTGLDVTESHLLSQQLNYQASHDPLTGLVNRREFETRLARVVKSCRHDDTEHALCYIDLDQFKVVNDTCGHDAGDELLRQISALLKHKLRKRDTIARLGGDEFGLLLERCSLKQARRVAETVREAIDQFRFNWAGRNFRLGASIGVIPINFSSGNITKVMRSADAACYAAKDAGRNRIHIYSEDNIEVAQRHREMQRIVDINQAFDEARLMLYQQPIIALGPQPEQQERLCEVLVRMIAEDGYPILPAEFLPTAERYNLAYQLDTWVVNATLQWLAANREISATINVSGMSIANDEFLQFVLDALARIDISFERLCFEVTETAAIENMSKANHFIKRLSGRGCKFALDDFGSGLSSFAYLKTLPVDYLKIDGFFVRDMTEDRINYELVKSINDIGHVMGKKTIAEFVENQETLEALREIGVDYAQGFGIAKPRPIE